MKTDVLFKYLFCSQTFIYMTLWIFLEWFLLDVRIQFLNVHTCISQLYFIITFDIIYDLITNNINFLHLDRPPKFCFTEGYDKPKDKHNQPINPSSHAEPTQELG